MLDEWEQSGKSGAAFARSIGVVPQRLFWWRSRLGRGGPSKAPALLPVHVRAAPATVGAMRAPVLVTTAGGVQIEVAQLDAASAAWVVAVLGAEGGR